MTGTVPRSLAAELRRWDEADLADLLAARPDLAVPLPHDLGALAHRATLRPSVQLAVDGLDLPTLQVLEAVVVLPAPTSAERVSAAWGADARPRLDRLRALALLRGEVEGAGPVHAVRTVREVLGPHPAGLGPPLGPGEGHLADPDHLAALLDSAPDGARTVLDRLVWNGPTGRLAGADREPDAASERPLDWLLARGLLVAADAEHVVLPREIALALRGGRTHRDPAVRRPDLAPHPAPGADAAAASSAVEAVRLVEALIELWGLAPPPVLRSGGLGVRELRRTAAALDVDQPTTARIVEIAHAAGLVADDGEIDPRWAPTPDADVWLARDVPRRWSDLVLAYLTTSRCPHLVGTRDSRNAVRNALGGELNRPAAPGIRAWLLRTLAAVECGRAVDQEALTELFGWTTPRRATPSRRQLLDSAAAEGLWLGLLTGLPGGRLALPRQARPWVEPDDVDGSADAGRLAAAALDEVLPAPVQAVLLQADLTAIAPGPLHPAVDRELHLVADVESRGGATVFRFTPDSVRRALDAGRTGDDVLVWLREHSSTPVPQPLEYLVADAARRHGRLRVGTAQAFVRSDDEAALAEVLADRRAEPLRLRRLAPTVLAGQADPGTVLEVLRSMGLAPVAESSDGTVVLAPARRHRTGTRRRPQRARPAPPVPSRATLLAAATALRLTEQAAGDRVDDDGHGGRGGDHGERPPGAVPVTDVATVLVQLEAALARRSPVWVSYVDGDGRAGQRLVQPIEVAAGHLSAVDRRTARIVTLPIARVSGVRPART